MLSVVMYGPPGSGKGTQSQVMGKEFEFEHISTGDILRSEIRNGTSLGLDAQGFMDRGELVPDSVIMGMIDKKVVELAGKSILFDGIPRTVPQAKVLDGILAAAGRKVDAVISLEVGENELVTRLLNRGKDSGRTDDADEATIRKRLSEYRQKTKEVAVFYQKSQRSFFPIDGERSIADVAEQLKGIVGKISQ